MYMYTLMYGTGFPRSQVALNAGLKHFSEENQSPRSPAAAKPRRERSGTPGFLSPASLG